MKAEVLSVEGKKIKEVNLDIFSKEIREDLAQKLFETEKKISPYAPYLMAGKQHSASGRVRHSRRQWRTSYGHGMSRVPRKIFWRRGTHFYWVGAEIASTRGGRRAHPPKIVHFFKKLKINKKEAMRAFESAIASTGDYNYIKKRYEKIKEIKVPIIIEDKILKLKTKEFFSVLNKILGENFELVLKNKEIRAGKGKSRGRRYKENAGLLLIIGKSESAKIQGIEVMKADELKMKSLFPLGRLTVYTENAVNELNKLGEKEK